ncbi:PREDICTED: magnesium transporter MRS2 homolog, mitochondrial-like [Chinchilla lanigera]|uniref:magnesium transporter MRS2 homolog, mitochondrial-like n=1 Tax=Chinchilla lanigera TaxID=34839 RepID=UPI0006964EB7|nr:PREDICTED: magnesium transporter MRS2 homolog, mitochondrial-like [Chinchilla lanigera]
MECLRILTGLLPRRTLCALALGLCPVARPVASCGRATRLLGRSRAAPLFLPSRTLAAGEVHQFRTLDVSQATLASVAPVFTVTKFDQEGNVTSFGQKIELICSHIYNTEDDVVKKKVENAIVAGRGGARL